MMLSRMVDPVDPGPNLHWPMVRRLGMEMRRILHSPDVRCVWGA
jgi:hypothetical protein